MRGALLLALLAAGTGGACVASFEQSARFLAAPAHEATEPVLARRRTYHDRGATRLRVEWQELVQPGKPPVLHGLRTEYHRDGTPASERRFEHGEPAGLWRAWHEDGTPRMEADLSAEDGCMRWWHANGALSSRGPLRRGVRTGEWEHYREDGSLAARGTYAHGVRDGEWILYDANGAWTERGRYVGGVRFGEWRFAARDGGR